ncbi:MAG: hypothetical protein K2P70_18115 [Hyphomonadaceae bacterium]|nr:hypothetical protein [Hyphomonadaceae bacterium]
MRFVALIVIAALGACATAAAQDASPSLDGAWIVDLSTDPNTPYTQPMQLTLNADRTVSGSFYQSEIEAGRWRTDRGRTCLSFRTTDGVGPYHTAACLVGDRVEGQTWAEHRNFLFVWNAARAP